MDLNVLIGLFCLGFGLYTLVARQVAPHKFAKLGPMKEKFGKKGGFIVHFVGYTLMPLILGGALLYKVYTLGSF